ncbi:patatin-like phospholipase family protein [Agromyces protaetiae]|uniref:Patatin-like phospholipase family protein n=1 Tax=Agromyces protaetiae TaxID=2509455 RepID=A0A4P6FEA8_9MICO|nr:patatin-like phospholipase family protein [Agromyces protaetiae]QAY74126.1 patatin-like phospholipase family protein [Agromyces protaetiae]
MHLPSSPTPAGGRALVLGGGGSTGNAWLIGVVAGLFDAGLDVTAPDVTVGTSAGATAAAQLAGSSPAELFSAATATPPPRPSGSPSPTRARPVVDHLERLRALIAGSADLSDFRRKISAAALEHDDDTDASWSARWRGTVAARFPGAVWPERNILIAALDARTGEPVVFDRTSGVDLVDAVAASTSGGRIAYRIGDGAHLDGGYRANAENADLAAGSERVLVLSPLGGRSLHPEAWRTHLAAQVDVLRANGSRVEVVVPEPDAEHLFGANAMNLSLRPAAAHAGYEQGAALAEVLAGFWR